MYQIDRLDEHIWLLRSSGTLCVEGHSYICAMIMSKKKRYLDLPHLWLRSHCEDLWRRPRCSASRCKILLLLLLLHLLLLLLLHLHGLLLLLLLLCLHLQALLPPPPPQGSTCTTEELEDGLAAPSSASAALEPASHRCGNERASRSHLSWARAP